MSDSSADGVLKLKAERLSRMLEAVEGSETVFVMTHDNPDPDAIASAAALARLLDHTAGVNTRVAFGGIVGRAENRVLIQELGLEFVDASQLDDARSTIVAVVDTQPRAGNNALPPGRIASIVIDHHPLRPETEAATYADVRPAYGASSSIIVEYLRAAELEPDLQLATALFYAIQTETMDLGREAIQADVEASMYLYPLADQSAISRIRHARVPTGYFRAVHGAIDAARQYGPVVVVELDRLGYPDMVAEIADLFLRMEGVEWAIALGQYRDRLLLSLRTYQERAHAGQLVRAAIGDRGTAGGHGSMAGGQVSVKGSSADDVADLRAEIMRDLLRALDVADRSPKRLVEIREEAGTG